MAAAATMALTLVVMTDNVSSNSAAQRSRAKAFDVAESALDRGTYTLSKNWFDTQAEYNAWTTNSTSAGEAALYSTLRTDFPLSQFPSPTSGQFASVQFVDNQDPIDYSINYDKGQPNVGAVDLSSTPDNKMWVIAQGATGEHATRIMALVERKTINMQVPGGVAMAVGGNLYSNGGGNNPKVTVEIPGNHTNFYVKTGGTMDTTEVSQTPPFTDQQNGTGGSLDDVFPPSLVATLKATAIQAGRYFTSQAAAEASPVDADWAPTGGLSGLCVLDVPPGTVVTLKGDLNKNLTDVNGDGIMGPIDYSDKPGVLMVLGSTAALPVTLDYGGAGDFYGIQYTDGNVDKGHGSYNIHGMLVCTGTNDMRGTVNVMYNDNCITRLFQRFTLNVRLVENSWREIPPQ
jgi:hypothetical protein